MYDRSCSNEVLRLFTRQRRLHGFCVRHEKARARLAACWGTLPRGWLTSCACRLLGKLRHAKEPQSGACGGFVAASASPQHSGYPWRCSAQRSSLRRSEKKPSCPGKGHRRLAEWAHASIWWVSSTHHGTAATLLSRKFFKKQPLESSWGRCRECHSCAECLWCGKLSSLHAFGSFSRAWLQVRPTHEIITSSQESQHSRKKKSQAWKYNVWNAMATEEHSLPCQALWVQTQNTWRHKNHFKYGSMQQQ